MIKSFKITLNLPDDGTFSTAGNNYEYFLREYLFLPALDDLDYNIKRFENDLDYVEELIMVYNILNDAIIEEC